MGRTLATEPLTPESFAPFGDVISAGLRAGVSANQGTALRVDDAAHLENLRPAAKPRLAVFQVAPRALPFEVALLERHPGSSQAFLPLSCSRYLVCVAPTLPGGEPDLQGLRAFLCHAGHGINYRAGVWHHPMAALDAPAEFAMLAWEDGSSGDCELRPLAERFPVLIPSL